jgi:hypothetical protein
MTPRYSSIPFPFVEERGGKGRGVSHGLSSSRRRSTKAPRPPASVFPFATSSSCFVKRQAQHKPHVGEPHFDVTNNPDAGVSFMWRDVPSGSWMLSEQAMQGGTHMLVAKSLYRDRRVLKRKPRKKKESTPRLQRSSPTFKAMGDFSCDLKLPTRSLLPLTTSATTIPVEAEYANSLQHRQAVRSRSRERAVRISPQQLNGREALHLPNHSLSFMGASGRRMACEHPPRKALKCSHIRPKHVSESIDFQVRQLVSRGEVGVCTRVRT